MRVVLDISNEEWVDEYSNVRLVHPVSKQRSVDVPISVYDLKGLAVLIASQIADVPTDVRFAAQKILHIARSTAYHINLVRRFTGRLPLSDDDAVLLASKPQNIIAAALFRKTVGKDEISALINLERPETHGPTLFDLPGYEELKPWARCVRCDVEKWRTGRLHWSSIRRGALVSGPPGSGKTYFAGALANSLGFKLVSTATRAWQSARDLDDTLNAMRKTFYDANSAGGAVLFIEELDSIVKSMSRSTDQRGHHWHVVVAEFLTLLSGVGEGVIVLGASNFPELINAEILRAGRLDRHFALNLPDAITRAKILAFHTGHVFPIDSLIALAEHLEGRSGAELEEMVWTARNFARDEGRSLEIADLNAQMPQKARYSMEEQFRLAVHEAGHALVALNVGYATRATIEVKQTFDLSANAYLGGVTSYEFVEDRVPTETGLLNRIAVALAGMAAEAAVFGDRSIGSGGTVGSDIERATSIARRMVGSYGFGRSPIFNACVESVGDGPLPPVLEHEVMDILKAQYDRVLRILTNEREKIISLAGDAVSHRRISIEREGISDAA
ncbi:AAA family ATPase [Agrobacterium rosae]|uniref:AAA family ATPase n=1 Tax=Agrobacterium rosae TaxID=1972867 RepID=UPI003A7F70A1